MNIFFLSQSPIDAAQMQCDKHVVKMILETAQILSTAHRILDGTEQTIKVQTSKDKIRNKKVWNLSNHRNEILYNVTHQNHPCAVWCRESVYNYFWLWTHLDSLCKEYTHRYKKIHKVQHSGLLNSLMNPPENIKKENSKFSTPPQCMPQEYTQDSTVLAYREYYSKAKRTFAKWTNRNAPDWF